MVGGFIDHAGWHTTTKEGDLVGNEEETRTKDPGQQKSEGSVSG